MPEDLFWESTPGEVLNVLQKLRGLEEDRQHAARIRAGVVAAHIGNRLRKKGTKAAHPTDFWRKPDEDERMSPEEALQEMRAWAKAQNQKVH